MRLLLLMCSLMIMPALATEIYKTRDAQGRVIFSDRASDNAERVEQGNPIAMPPPEEMHFAESLDEEDQTPFQGYDELLIESPGNETTIPNGLAPQLVSVSLTPALQEGHQLELYIDGELFERSVSTNFTIPQLQRGPRDLQVLVTGDGGETLLRSESHRVYVLWPRKR